MECLARRGTERVGCFLWSQVGRGLGGMIEAMLGAFKGAAPPGRPRRVAYFVHEGFQLLDLAGPNAVFSVVNGLLGADHYDTQLCAAKAGMLSTEAGIRMAVSGPSAIVPELDTLLVVGGPRAHRLALDEPIRARFHRAAAAHVRIGSVCTGAFVLGAAGLLNERACTTHWAYAAELHQRYPQARVMAEQIFVCDRRLWSSAGVTAGIDLALAMVEDDHGPELAQAVAKALVVYHRRSAGQPQLSALLDSAPPHSPFSALNQWIREHLTLPLTVAQLASQAGMSTRNFQRSYKAHTGMTPAKAVERFRVEHAQALLTSGMGNIDEVARSCGFGHASRLRAAMRRCGSRRSSVPT